MFGLKRLTLLKPARELKPARVVYADALSLLALPLKAHPFTA